MKQRGTLVFVFLINLAFIASALAGPILKPRKYHGPIPRGAVALRIGFLAGTENDEMFDFLDRLVTENAGEANSNSFNNSWMVDVAYVYKVHPQFAVRANASASFLRSNSEGFFVANVIVPDTIPRPILDYQRDFDVDLFTLEASALYFFTDAAVKEFQPYFGGGFSVGFSHAKFKSTQVDRAPVDGFDFSNTLESDEWSMEPGVHAILGALYYVNNVFAATVEGRYQLMQSKYPLTVDTVDGPREVRFDVNYSGFMLTIGGSYAF